MFARRMDAFARQDVVSLTADYAEDCVVASALSGTLVGRAAVATTFRTFFVAFPDLTFTHEDLLMFGDQVVLLASVRGTDISGFLGRAPTGRPFSLFLVSLMKIRDGKIAHERRIYDRGGLLLQLAGESETSTDVSDLYAAALDRAILARDVSIAARIQQTLLPPKQHSAAGFNVAAISTPCRAIGGDFVEYFHRPDGAFAFVLGDVAGKGPPAALLAARLQGIFAGYDAGTPAEMLAHANRVLLRSSFDSRFATVVCGLLSPGGRLTYSNAGHNAPLVVGTNGVRRLDQGGLILGAFPDARFEEGTIQVEMGEVIVVFTDGVTEAFDPDGNEFGEERLVSCVARHLQLAPAALVDRVLDSVHEFSRLTPQHDDVTLLILRSAEYAVS